MKQLMPRKDDPTGSGGAICVQDVHAPLPAVWHQILDMNSYKSKVSKVNECKNYLVKKRGDGTTQIKTKQVLGVLPGYAVRKTWYRRAYFVFQTFLFFPVAIFNNVCDSSFSRFPIHCPHISVLFIRLLFLQYESYYDHTFYPQKSSLTWSLDYTRTSDFEDVAGHWHVIEHPTKGPGCSRVYYACDIQMKGTVPGPILNYISKAALKQATGWVKRESEAHPEKAIPSEYGQVPMSRTFAAKKKPNELTTAGGGSEVRRWSLWGLHQTWYGKTNKGKRISNQDTQTKKMFIDRRR
jgi:hypothetical protein